DVLENPKLPQSELDRLKNNMKRNLTVSLSTPGAQARKDFFAEMYPNHPYGRLYPTSEQVDSYTLNNVKSFYETNFGAQRTTIYVVGNFDAEKVKEVVKNQLADWRKGEKENYPIAQAQSSGKVQIIDRPVAPQSTIYYGLPTADPSNKDYIALDVMYTFLGASCGSRFTGTLREHNGYKH